MVDPDLIWSLPDGEIRRYDRRLNMICHDCRKVKLCSVCWLFIREIFRRWRSEYRHHDNDRYAPKFRSGTSRLALHHVPYMAMAGFHFPETVEKRRKQELRQKALEAFYDAFELGSIEPGTTAKIATKGDLMIVMFRQERAEKGESA